MCGWLKKLQDVGALDLFSGNCTFRHSSIEVPLINYECGKNTNDVHIPCLSAVRPSAEERAFRNAGLEVLIFMLLSFHHLNYHIAES